MSRQMLSDQEISLLVFLSNIKTWKSCLCCTSHNIFSNLNILISTDGKVKKGRLLFLSWRHWLIPWFPSYQLGEQWACFKVESHPLSNTFSLNCARLSQKVQTEILPPLNLMEFFHELEQYHGFPLTSGLDTFQNGGCLAANCLH